MNTGWSEMDNKTLAMCARNLKDNMMGVINDPNRMEVKDGRSASCLFPVTLFSLMAVEAEIRNRGMDPSHPTFGRDLMRDIAEVQADLMAGKEI